MLGLSGRYHAALSGLITTNEVKKSRPHLKMLVGDFYTYQVKSENEGSSPHCRVCIDENVNEGSSQKPPESLCHILTCCEAYSDIRMKYFQEYSNLLQHSMSEVNFIELRSNNEMLCQFILDPTSINLPIRINQNDPISSLLFKTSRDLCFMISERRIKIIREKASKL